MKGKKKESKRTKRGGGGILETDVKAYRDRQDYKQTERLPERQTCSETKR